MFARSLELIDEKRAALKLPAYDPAQFGDSGDSLYFAAIKDYLAEKAESRSAASRPSARPSTRSPRATRTTTATATARHAHGEEDA